MEHTITMTTTQLQRYEVLSQLIGGHIHGTEASIKLNLSVRHIKRLKKRVREKGAEGLAHGNQGKESGRRIKETIRDQACTLLKSTYADCKPTFASEKLAECHGIHLSRETVRNMMTTEGLWKPKVHKDTPQYRSKRPRMDMEGEMEQYDGSYHVWIEALGEEVCLLASIDDATGRITRAWFDHHEGVVPTFTFWRGYATDHGHLPKRLYVDKFSTYKVNHKHAQDDSGMVTQFERALNTLGVDLIRAHSPQAKGRIERLFETLQDRLVKEMRYAGITTIEEANVFLADVFIPKFNAKFGVPARTQGNARVPVPTEVDLASVFAVHDTRQVQNDFTIRFQNRWYQIEKVQSVTVLRKDVVRMETRLDGTVAVYHERRGAYLRVTCVPEQPERKRETQMIPATTRKPHIPSANHPWRRFVTRDEGNAKNTELVTIQV
jgi:hypothetical protein